MLNLTSRTVFWLTYDNMYVTLSDSNRTTKVVTRGPKK